MGFLTDSMLADILLRIEERIKKQNELLQELINIESRRED